MDEQLTTPPRQRPWWRRPKTLAAISAGIAVLAVASVLTGLGVRDATAEDSTGLLRVAHLSPSTPSVDMYVSGADTPPTKVASGVSYRGLTPYLFEPSGTYTLQARPAGAPPSSPPALSVSVTVPAGTAQTAAFVDVGADQAPQLQVLDDQTAPAAPGTAQLRVVAAAADLGPLQVQTDGGPQLARDLFYGSATPYVTVPARPWRIELTTRAGATGEVDVPLASGAVGSLVVTREPGGKLVGQVVPDAASAVAVPGPGATPTTVPATPTTTPAPDETTPLPAPPRAPAAPTGGIGAGLGGLAAERVDVAPADDADESSDNSAPPAPRFPVIDALAPPSGLRPAGIQAPTVGLDVPKVGDLRIDYRGALQVPTDYSAVGWYTGSVVPGDAGPAVLVGHVDTQRGPAVFAQLDHLRPGDPIDVPRSDGATAHFRVDSVEYYPKDNIPTERIYGPSASPTLRLLTCGGPFDQRTLNYRDNLVVFASQRR